MEFRPVTQAENILASRFYEFADTGPMPLISEVVTVSGFADPEPGVILVFGATVIVTTISDITIFKQCGDKETARRIAEWISKPPLAVTQETLKQLKFRIHDQPLRFGLDAFSEPL